MIISNAKIYAAFLRNNFKLLPWLCALIGLIIGLLVLSQANLNDPEFKQIVAHKLVTSQRVSGLSNIIFLPVIIGFAIGALLDRKRNKTK